MRVYSNELSILPHIPTGHLRHTASLAIFQKKGAATII